MLVANTVMTWEIHQEQLVMLDKALRKGVGWGLVRLRPQQRPRPLHGGETRFFVSEEELLEEASH